MLDAPQGNRIALQHPDRQWVHAACLHLHKHTLLYSLHCSFGSSTNDKRGQLVAMYEAPIPLKQQRAATPAAAVSCWLTYACNCKTRWDFRAGQPSSSRIPQWGYTSSSSSGKKKPQWGYLMLAMVPMHFTQDWAIEKSLDRSKSNQQWWAEKNEVCSWCLQ